MGYNLIFSDGSKNEAGAGDALVVAGTNFQKSIKLTNIAYNSLSTELTTVYEAL